MAISPALRSAVIRLLVTVAALDVVVLAVYYGARVATRPVSTQYVFVGVWLVISLVVVLDGLKRVRAARLNPGRDEMSRSR